MTPYPQQYRYQIFEKRRRANLYRYYLIQHNIAVIKQIIAAGGDPLQNHDISAEYMVLINEFGTSIFEDEAGRKMMVTEQERVADVKSAIV